MKIMTIKYNNIVIAGQGAMGLLWYHHLSQSSSTNSFENISLLASNQSLLVEQQETHVDYEFCAYQQNERYSYPLIYSKEQDIACADIIMLCLKSVHIADTVKRIAQKIKANCIVILAHNGLGVFEEVVDLLGKQQVIVTLLTTHGCFRQSPLSIKHTGLGKNDLGLLAGHLPLMQRSQLANKLQDALPEVAFHKNIKEKQWLKLAVNCVINPLTAIHNIDNGALLNKKFSVQITNILIEIIEVSRSQGIHFTLSGLQDVVKEVARATSANCSSMRSDILSGAVTEIDYINGYIHLLGESNQINTPENTQLWRQVRALTHPEH
jgi:2-dehydropantoate 2-reductase